MKIGFAIQSIRKKQFISQFELAEKCGLSTTSLSQIETGRKHPAPETLTKLCEGLGVPLAIIYLIAMEQEDVPPSKKAVYSFGFPSIMKLALKLIGKDYEHLFPLKYIDEPTG